MNFEIYTTPRFERSAKTLAKRHRSLKTDLAQLIASLEKNPNQGDELTPGIRKVRMSIASKGRGKSGGARVITYTVFADSSNGRLYLIDIYDKADYSTVDVGLIAEYIKDLDIVDRI